ncbi:minor capsid protein [Anaeromassilibacillus senegalensis]|uniref:minor capsid protein n=1 Tax=Anaeromassilibacillus senegalensis TaxID=1673717 RepID=UPI0006837AE2|nr:minor capsid protein [Anaeromassilibacillus senegalensis]
MRRDKEYWIARAIQRENEAYLRGAGLSAKMFQEYDTAAKEIRRQINDFYSKYAGKHGLTYEQAVRLLSRSEFREWKASLGDYVEKIAREPDPRVKALLTVQLDALSTNSSISRLEALQGQIDLILNDLFEKGVAQMKAEFGDAFQEGYYKKIFDIQSRAGFLNEFAKLNEGMIENVLSYPWSGAMFSDRLWQNKQALMFHLRETITQGVMQGKSVAAMSKEMSAKMGQSYKTTERLIRTETAHFHSEADKAAYRAAGVQEYEFVATLDSRTSDVCASLDGEHFKLEDAQEGVNYPPLHPNCRSTTVEYDPDDALDWYNSGNPMPENMTYEEWLKTQDTREPKPESKSVTKSNKMLESSQDKVYNNGIEISEKQFGKKIGKHTVDFGMDPSDPNSREKMRAIIQDIVLNRDEIVHGTWRGLGEILPNGQRAAGPADFIIKGQDVVVAQNGKFVTIIKNGLTSNLRIKNAKEKGGL